MYQCKAKLIKVVDVDTVDALIDCGFSTFKKERIRLHGINAPESRTRNKEEKIRGLLSKDYLKSNCYVGSTIRLKSKERGKFGRILGVIYKEDDTISMNQIMCEEGFAVPYFGGNKDKLEELHMINKQKLIEKGLLEE